MNKEKKPAHEVIVELLKKSIDVMNDVDRPTQEWACHRSKIDVLCETLGEIDIPEGEIPRVIGQLTHLGELCQVHAIAFILGATAQKLYR